MLNSQDNKDNSKNENKDTQAKATVLVHPKVIYWVDMPDILQPRDRIELLKHDVMIKSVISEKINTLQKENDAAYIINLDKYISKNRIGKLPSEYSLSQKVLGIIQSLNPQRTIVHTTMIDPTISALFKNAGVKLIEKNIESKKNAVAIIGKFVSFLFRDDGRLRRDFVRIQLPEKSENPIRVMNLRTNVPGIRGVVRDLSLNGIGIKLEAAQNISFFQLKDPVKLEFYIEGTKFNIKMAFVARIYSPASEVGFIFNIRNPNMITDDVATSYSSLIYTYLRELLNS